MNEQLCKQIDGVPMGGKLSVVLSDCFMKKMERNVVIPLKPTFYKRFVDDIYRGRKRNEPDELFDKMNSCHPNIKLAIEIIPKKFLEPRFSEFPIIFSVLCIKKRKKTDSLEFSSTKKL